MRTSVSLGFRLGHLHFLGFGCGLREFWVAVRVRFAFWVRVGVRCFFVIRGRKWMLYGNVSEGGSRGSASGLWVRVLGLGS